MPWSYFGAAPAGAAGGPVGSPTQSRPGVQQRTKPLPKSESGWQSGTRGYSQQSPALWTFPTSHGVAQQRHVPSKHCPGKQSRLAPF